MPRQRAGKVVPAGQAGALPSSFLGAAGTCEAVPLRGVLLCCVRGAFISALHFTRRESGGAVLQWGEKAAEFGVTEHAPGPPGHPPFRSSLPVLRHR